MEAAMSRALNQIIKEQAADSLPRLAEVLRTESVPPSKSLAGIQTQLAQLIDGSAQKKSILGWSIYSKPVRDLIDHTIDCSSVRPT